MHVRRLIVVPVVARRLGSSAACGGDADAGVPLDLHRAGRDSRQVVLHLLASGRPVQPDHRDTRTAASRRRGRVHRLRQDTDLCLGDCQPTDSGPRAEERRELRRSSTRRRDGRSGERLHPGLEQCDHQYRPGRSSYRSHVSRPRRHDLRQLLRHPAGDDLRRWMALDL